MPDWNALETYLRDTAGALFALGAESLGARGPSLEPAASQARPRLWPDRPDARSARPRRERPRLSPGRCACSPRDLARGGAGGEDRRWPARRACRTARRRRRTPWTKRAVMSLSSTHRAQTAFLPLCLVDPYLAALEQERARSSARDRRHQPALPALAHGKLAGVAATRPRPRPDWRSQRSRSASARSASARFRLEALAAARAFPARGRWRRDRREQAEIDVHRLEASRASLAVGAEMAAGDVVQQARRVPWSAAAATARPQAVRPRRSVRR